MVHAKNYETMSTFVKVMQKKRWPLFFRTRCRLNENEVDFCITPTQANQLAAAQLSYTM